MDLRRRSVALDAFVGRELLNVCDHLARWFHLLWVEDDRLFLTLPLDRRYENRGFHREALKLRLKLDGRGCELKVQEIVLVDQSLCISAAWSSPAVALARRGAIAVLSIEVNKKRRAWQCHLQQAAPMPSFSSLFSRPKI